MEYTWYVRDAQGNLLTVYGDVNNATDFSGMVPGIDEWYIYGSNRLGSYQYGIGMYSGPSQTQYIHDYFYVRGAKQYELTNHLGNLIVNLTDKKIGVTSDSITKYFKPDVVNAWDYYPFGMGMPQRIWTNQSYRFGFNGKERDEDVKSYGRQIDYGNRIYDPRVGRFLSEDPIRKKYPELTPYQFASNSPIEGVDLDGLEKITYFYKFTAEQITKTKIEYAKAGPLGNGVLVKSDFGGVNKYFYGNTFPSLPALIGSYEGVKKDKEGNHVYYLDKKQIPTIGYGHRVYPNEPYKPGTTLTEKQATNLFNVDQKRITARADEFLKGLTLNINQRDALYELSFNGGAGKVLNFKHAIDGMYGGENYFLQPKYLSDIDANVKRRYADNLLYSENLYIHLDKISSSNVIKSVENFMNPPKKGTENATENKKP